MDRLKKAISRHLLRTRLGFEMNSLLRRLLLRTRLGVEMIFLLRKCLNRLPVPDYAFPEYISLELTNSCNLKCVHCPSHSAAFKEFQRRNCFMDYGVFDKLLEEIDAQGKRSIALHKDGEPLLHPELGKFLERVKRNVDHYVYLTTNAHLLTDDITKQIFDARIDTVNFSIGAISEEFYKKVRGGKLKKVLENIHRFLELRKLSSWKPWVIVQIINLPEYSEMAEEIATFRRYWSNHDVGIAVWEKLNWGVLNSCKINIKRYPCYSLWKFLFVNADASVSVCCMDWRHELVVGSAESQTLQEVWRSPQLQDLRRIHMENREDSIPICRNCNYWSRQPKTANYHV